MHALTLALLTLLAVSVVGVTMTGSAFAFHPLFLTASKTTLSFTGTSKLTLLRGLSAGVLGTIDCEKGASSGLVLNKSTLATKVEVEYSGKCEQTIIGIKTACTEPLKFKLTFVELGLTGSKKAALLLAPESGTELVKVTCGTYISTFEGAVVAEIPENNSTLEKQYNTSRSTLELVFKSESKNQNQAITSIELSGLSMTKVLLKVSGFLGGNASLESTQTISFDSGVLICTTSPSACGSASGGKESTTLTTTLSGEGKENAELTILEGSKAKDKATLSGKNAGSATGKVRYKIYSDSKCETLVKEAGNVTVTSGSVPASNEEELEAGKTYYWQATYEGDSLNSASTSACGSEVLSVKAKTSLSTKLSGEGKENAELTILEGSKAKDKATLSGTNSSTAGGKLVYKIYSDSKCETLVKEAGEVTVTSGSVPASNEEELEGGKAYYWQAHYIGDSLHQESTSSCGSEVLTVRAKTTLTTTLSGEGKEGEELELVEGAEISDHATLSGAGTATATGTVTYDVYSDSECKELVKEAGEVTVSGGSVPGSSEVTLSAGTYYWQAVYSGDVRHQGSTSTCGTEINVVTAAVTTLLSGEGQTGTELEVVEGTAVKDTATLYGAHTSTASGTVKYDVYSDPECKELVKEAGEVTVTSGSVPASSEETLSTGMYYWQADYSGDSEKPAEKSACGTEVELVQTSTSLTTSLSSEGKTGEPLEVEEGAPIKDAATLSGANTSTAAGYVKYEAYSDSECKELAAEAGDVSVTSGSVPASEEEILPVGTYYWQATYTGDKSNHGSTSTCGSEVSIVTAPVTTSLSGEGQSGDEVEVEEEAGVKDTAALHGPHASTATGTVKYDVYSDPECKELVKEAGEVTVTSGSVPSSLEETLPAGDYYWRASYSGDGSNPAAQSACDTEVEIVRPPDGRYAALGDSFSAGVGASPYYPKTKLGTEERENKCHRSPQGYPGRVAEALYPGLPVTEAAEVFKQQPPSFIFRACDGAVSWNLWGGGFANGQYNEWIEGSPGEWLSIPAQDLWLARPGGTVPTEPNNKVVLVTLTIGGNDAGFGLIGRNCVSPSAEPDLMRRINMNVGRYSSARCEEVITEWETGVKKMSGAGPPEEQAEGIPSLMEKLPVVLSNIHEFAPRARIRIPLYPQIINTTRSGKIVVGIYTLGSIAIIFNVENSAPRGEIGIATKLERFTGKLNRTITATVQKWAREERVDARVIPGTVDAFNGHRLGDQPAQLWVKEVGLELILGRPTVAIGSLHPNCLGYKAMAERVLQSLRRAVPGGWAC